MKYTYIDMKQIGNAFYIIIYDYKGNKIDVSKPYTKVSANQAYKAILAHKWCKPYERIQAQ